MARSSAKKTTPKQHHLDHPDLGSVEQIAVGLLKPYPGNARTHDERQLAKLKQSLQSFGWMNPILRGSSRLSPMMAAQLVGSWSGSTT